MFGGVDDDLDDRLAGDEEFADGLGILFPNFGWNRTRFLFAILKVEFDENGHEDAAFVFEVGNGEMLLCFEKTPFTRLQLFEEFLVFFALCFGDFGRLFLVVEILEAIVFFDVFREVFVALGDDVLFTIFLFLGLF